MPSRLAELPKLDLVHKMTAGAERAIYPLKGVAGLCFLVAMPAFCLASELTGTEAYLGFACLLGAVALFWRSSTHRFGSLSLVGMFSLAAAMHAVVGFLLAPSTTDAIWAGTRVADFFPKAFLVIATGLLVASIGYGTGLRWRMDRITGWCKNLTIDDSKLVRWTQVLTIAGAALIILVYYKVGYIPLLSSAPGQSRYIAADASRNLQIEEWLVNRGMDLITDALPVVLVWCFWGRGWRNFLIVATGCVALLLPLRRANFASIVVSVVIMQFLRTGRLRKRYLAIVALVVLSYAASQLMFVNMSGQGEDVSATITSMGTALPEVRDLGWMMSLSNEPWYGATFFQALLPIPSFISDFSKQYGIGGVTTRIIGMEDDRTISGLRLTLAGESYLNFGYVGLILISLLFGMACAALDVAIARLREYGEIAGLYLGSLLFGWLCFWLYLGGTGASAAIKVGVFLVAGLFLLSWRRVPRTSVA